MRARGIKPGFFVNADLVQLPPLVRLLFVGLWCYGRPSGSSQGLAHDHQAHRPTGRRLRRRPDAGCPRRLTTSSCAIRWERAATSRCGTSPSTRAPTSRNGKAPYRHQTSHGTSTLQEPCQHPLTPDSGLLTADSRENILSAETPDPPTGNGSGPSKAALVRGRFEHWRATFPEETRRMSLTKDRQRAISARLAEGIAPSTIDEAVTNARGDPWWNGAKDGEWKADIKTICGKGSTVENLAARSRQGRTGLERLRAEYGGEA